jgi:hypothetical protein
MSDPKSMNSTENPRLVEGRPFGQVIGEFTGDVVECDGEICRVHVWSDTAGYRLDLMTPQGTYRAILEEQKPGDPEGSPRRARRWATKLDALNYAATLGHIWSDTPDEIEVPPSEGKEWDVMTAEGIYGAKSEQHLRVIADNITTVVSMLEDKGALLPIIDKLMRPFVEQLSDLLADALAGGQSVHSVQHPYVGRRGFDRRCPNKVMGTIVSVGPGFVVHDQRDSRRDTLNKVILPTTMVVLRMDPFVLDGTSQHHEIQLCDLILDES